MLVKRIKEDFMKFWKEKKIEEKNLLGLVKWEILLIEKERECLDIDVINIIKKLLKWINESLKAKESKELLLEKEILETYLPKELTEKEIEEILSNLHWASDIWSIMKYFKENYGGRVDNKLLMTIIKR